MNKIQSHKNKLIKKYDEQVKCSDYRDALGKNERGRGIYVLFKKTKIYYIGLSKSSLRARLRKHATKDRHKGKWDTYSFYQIGRTKFIKDIETLLLRICQPPGNKNGGRFKKKYNLAKQRIRNAT
ncbi:MAG: GIY-YIG nuclease family protein [Nitrospirae bacterium]|nr:GIY-YIG nuclease family protein [Nitrospirota bacterium]